MRTYKQFRDDDVWFTEGKRLVSLSDLYTSANEIGGCATSSSRFPEFIETQCFNRPLRVHIRDATKTSVVRVDAPRQIPAAQYVRMSTNLQEYSIENQKEAIRTFAERRGMRVVRTYEDRGKSGLLLKHRAGLTALLQDVIRGKAEYQAILVYDISRWGRFQDPDESAHYEFLCRSYGIPVYHCAEPFEDDGTLQNSMLKAIKRTMAGEYSRELSAKVFEGEKRLAQCGYRLGSRPGFACVGWPFLPMGTKKEC